MPLKTLHFHNSGGLDIMVSIVHCTHKPECVFMIHIWQTSSAEQSFTMIDGHFQSERLKAERNGFANYR